MNALNNLTSPKHGVPGMTDEIHNMLKDLATTNWRMKQSNFVFNVVLYFRRAIKMGKKRSIDRVLDWSHRENTVHSGYRILSMLVRTCFLMDEESKWIVMIWFVKW